MLLAFWFAGFLCTRKGRFSSAVLKQAKSRFIPKITHLDTLTITSFFEEKLFWAAFIAAIVAIASYRQSLYGFTYGKHNTIEIEA